MANRSQPRAFYILFFVVFPLGLAGAVALLLTDPTPSARLIVANVALAFGTFWGVAAYLRERRRG